MKIKHLPYYILFCFLFYLQSTHCKYQHTLLLYLIYTLANYLYRGNIGIWRIRYNTLDCKSVLSAQGVCSYPNYHPCHWSHPSSIPSLHHYSTLYCVHSGKHPCLMINTDFTKWSNSDMYLQHHSCNQSNPAQCTRLSCRFGLLRAKHLEFPKSLFHHQD